MKKKYKWVVYRKCPKRGGALVLPEQYTTCEERGKCEYEEVEREVRVR